MTKSGRSDKMALVAFMQAGSTSVYAGSWRHPATEHRYLDASYYAKIGRQLEEDSVRLTKIEALEIVPVHGTAVGDASLGELRGPGLVFLHVRNAERHVVYTSGTGPGW